MVSLGEFCRVDSSIPQAMVMISCSILHGAPDTRLEVWLKQEMQFIDLAWPNDKMKDCNGESAANKNATRGYAIQQMDTKVI